MSAMKENVFCKQPNCYKSSSFGGAIFKLLPRKSRTARKGRVEIKFLLLHNLEAGNPATL